MKSYIINDIDVEAIKYKEKQYLSDIDILFVVYNREDKPLLEDFFKQTDLIDSARMIVWIEVKIIWKVIIWDCNYFDTYINLNEIKDICNFINWISNWIYLPGLVSVDITDIVKLLSSSNNKLLICKYKILDYDCYDFFINDNIKDIYINILSPENFTMIEMDQVFKIIESKINISWNIYFWHSWSNKLIKPKINLIYTI